MSRHSRLLGALVVALAATVTSSPVRAGSETGTFDVILRGFRAATMKYAARIEGDRYSFGGTSSLAAISGLPSVVLPGGDVTGLPVNVGFVGAAFSEPDLLRYAQALEAALDARLDPAFRPSLESGAPAP